MDKFPRKARIHKKKFFNRQYYDIALNNYSYLLPDIVNIVTQYFTSNSLIILGGEKISDGSVILYHENNKEWVDLPPLPTERSCHTSLVYDNKIYVMGGKYDNERPRVLNRVDLFDFSVFQWVPLQNLLTRRHFCGSCIYHDLIYVIGGGEPRQLNSVEVFNPKQPFLGWSYLSSQLNIPRAGCISIVYNDTIYVIGGYDGVHYLDSVEMYDSVNEVWLFAQNLYNRLTSFSAVATKDYIYVIGGNDNGNKITDTVTRSDMKSPWVSLPNLPEERHNTGIALVDNTIYLVGGFSKTSTVSTSFSMDLSDPNPTWSTFNIPQFRYNMSCVSAPIFTI